MSNNSELKASDFKVFHIGRDINLYYPPALVFVGTIGNILSFLVYIQPQYRKKSSSVYILAMSVVDSLNLLVGLLQYWILFNFFPKAITRRHCEGMYFVVNWVGNYAHWIIVGFTMDRFIAIYFPFWTLTKLSWKRTTMGVVAIGTIAALKNLHYVWTTDFVYNSKTGAATCAFGLVNKASWVKIYQTFEVAISSIIPFIIILILNAFIILRMNQNRTKRSKMSNQQSKHSSSSGDAEKSVTITLIMVSTSFIVTTCPLLVFRLYFAGVNIRNDPRQEALYSLGHHICHKLWYTNNGINFFLYSLCARSFRKNIKKLLCFEKKLNKNATISTNTLKTTSMMSLSRISNSTTTF